MTFEISNIINELQSRLMGYCALLTYRYMNLCVKAEPAALLSAEVNVGGAAYPLEKVASVAIEDNTRYRLYPMDKNLVPEIVKAMKEEHPEFKADIDGETIVFTVPPVDKDRKDALNDLVDALHKDCESRMKLDFGVSTAKVAVAVAALSKEEQDGAKEDLKKAYDGMVSRSGQLKDNKIKEIEAAYSAWCDEHEKNEEAKEEKARAEGLDNVFKMTLEN